MAGNGTSAGALAWWKTIVPAGKVPSSWTSGAGNHVVTSGDGVYMFAGQSNADGSGYGNISWQETDSSGTPKSQQTYVRWGTDGLTSNGTGTGSDPAPVDPGQVTPVQPFGSLDWTSGLGTLLGNLTDKAMWVRIGEGAAAVLILGIGFYLLLHKEGFVNGASPA